MLLLATRTLGVLILSSISICSFSSCTDVFFQGTPPEIPEKLNSRTYNICGSTFFTKYSGITKTGLYSAEIVTYKGLLQAKKIKRVDSFHEDTNITSYGDKVYLKDYRYSGYDRGHLAPNSDRVDEDDQFRSFSLTNIIPQSPKNNQGVWMEAERVVRYLVIKNKATAFVITGGLYLEPRIKTIGSSKVFIPSHIYKVVYLPTQNIAAAFISKNDDTDSIDLISIDDLQKLSHIIFFPNLPNQLIQNKSNIPLSLKRN